MVCVLSRALVLWCLGRVRAVPGIFGYPWIILVRWNILHGYLMHRSPQVPRTPSRTTPIRSFSATHTPRALYFAARSGILESSLLVKIKVDNTRG